MWAVGGYHAVMREFEESMTWNDQTVAILRQMDEPFDLAWALHSEGLAATHLGEHERAHTRLDEALDMMLAAGDKTGLPILFGDYADLAKAEGDIDRALRLRGATAALQDLTGSSLEELMQTQWTSYRIGVQHGHRSGPRALRRGPSPDLAQALDYATGEWEPGSRSATAGDAPGPIPRRLRRSPPRAAPS